MAKVHIGDKLKASAAMHRSQQAKLNAQPTAQPPQAARPVPKVVSEVDMYQKVQNVMLDGFERAARIVNELERARIEMYGKEFVLNQRAQQAEIATRAVEAVGGALMEIVRGITPTFVQGLNTVIEAGSKAEALRATAEGKRDAEKLSQ